MKICNEEVDSCQSCHVAYDVVLCEKPRPLEAHGGTMSDDVENIVRRAFALAINTYDRKRRPDAYNVDFNFVRSSYYELSTTVDGYKFIGSWYSNADTEPLVQVVLEKVIAPDGSVTLPNFWHRDFKSDLGPEYKSLYDG